MSQASYLQWLSNDTSTTWWHDSGDPDELETGLAHGITGVTTNPVLIAKTLRGNPTKWAGALEAAKESGDSPRDEMLVRAVVMHAAAKVRPVFERTGGKLGYVCAQVNPSLAGDREAMLQMALRFRAWAPNIAVKLPATAAGLDVLEDCAAEGISVTSTVSFTVPQVLAAAERHRMGMARAERSGKKPGRCFTVIMIGRLDEYLEAIARDQVIDVSLVELKQAGIAVAKRAYSLFKQRQYEAVLMVAALRGTYHTVELTGAELVMSIHPKYQAMLLKPGVPREPNRIGIPVAAEVIEKLQAISEFVRAYEPDGMKPSEFAAFGLTQRTLSEFIFAGWSMI